MHWAAFFMRAAANKGCAPICICQTAWLLEYSRRDEADQWIYTVLSEPADVLEIPALGIRLPLADVYDDTDVAPLSGCRRPIIDLPNRCGVTKWEE